MKRFFLLLMFAATLDLTACASGPAPVNPAYFDLGPVGAPLAAPAGAPLPVPLKVAVDAPGWLDSASIYYRLPAGDGSQARAYANSRWLAPPPVLFADHLRVRLARQGKVLDAGDPVAVPLLKIDLNEFTQYFDGPSASHGVVLLRASVFNKGQLAGQTTIRSERPAPSADAAGGAAALAAASTAAQDALVQWLATLPLAGAVNAR